MGAPFLKKFLNVMGVEVEAAGVVQDLASKVKEVQKTYRDEWHEYCDQAGNGVRDPAKHDAAFLQQFLARYGDNGNSAAWGTDDSAWSQGSWTQGTGKRAYAQSWGQEAWPTKRF